MSHLLRLSSLQRWSLYERVFLSSRRCAAKVAKKKNLDPALADTWKRDVVLGLNSDLKLEHKRYGAQKQLLIHEHKVVWLVFNHFTITIFCV
jgi:hypothetical protein